MIIYMGVKIILLILSFFSVEEIKLKSKIAFLVCQQGIVATLLHPGATSVSL